MIPLIATLLPLRSPRPFCEIAAFTQDAPAFRKLCDGKMANDMFYLDFDDAPSAFDGTSGKLRKALASGRTPWIKGSPQMRGYRQGEPGEGKAWDEILAGKLDGYLRACGTALAKAGRPLRLDFAHEMNGGWKPYGMTGKRGTGATTFVAAWRRVHDLVVAGGAKNVVWVWTPASLRAPSDPGDPRDTSRLYPGDVYVDEIGFSVCDKKARVGESFKALFADSYAMGGRIAPTKPIVISEMGCSSADPNKAAWVGTTFASTRDDLPRVQAFNWFNRDSHGKKARRARTTGSTRTRRSRRR